MEFNEKLQELRRQKGLTQEELAEVIYVSRTAVSKWESGRGYPNIDSLKNIARFFGVTVDDLISSERLLTIAEEDTKQTQSRFRDLVFGLLDVSAAMLLFLPFFGQHSGDAMRGISLLSLTEIAPYLKILYFVFVFAIIITGILTLALQNYGQKFRGKLKSKISLFLSAAGAILFVVSMQPYAATFLFIILIIKALMLIKWQ